MTDYERRIHELEEENKELKRTNKYVFYRHCGATILIAATWYVFIIHVDRLTASWTKLSCESLFSGVGPTCWHSVTAFGLSALTWIAFLAIGFYVALALVRHDERHLTSITL